MLHNMGKSPRKSSSAAFFNTSYQSTSSRWDSTACLVLETATSSIKQQVARRRPLCKTLIAYRLGTTPLLSRLWISFDACSRAHSPAVTFSLIKPW